MKPAASRPSVGGRADMTGRQLGRYEVLAQLASGGMATVYVARAQGVAGFERLVAVKVLHPHLAHDEEFISMFLDEARLAASIRHPNVVGTLDISDSQGDGYFLVMEYVEGDHFGGLLRNAARGQERLPIPVVTRILIDALSGLSAAHLLTDGRGEPLDIVHRDVSPHNILVGADGIARITDFGVAKAQVRLSSTRDGQFKGKLSYMAPEQAASGNADQRSDLFSMGIVLWEGLTGRRLFRGENNADVLNKILNPAVPPPSDFDLRLAPFDPVLARALAKDPSERFQTAEEFIQALEEAAEQGQGVGSPRAVSREVKRWLGDKVDEERATIQTAIEALGMNEVVAGAPPLPMESGSQPSLSSARPYSEPPEPTIAAKPSTITANADAQSGDSRIKYLVVAAFVLCGALLAWFLFGAGTDAPPRGVTAETSNTATPEGESPESQGSAERTAEAAGAPPEAQPPETAATVEEPPEAQTQAEETQAEEAQAEEAQAEEAQAEETQAAPAARPRRARPRRRTPLRPRSNDDDDERIIVNPYRR